MDTTQQTLTTEETMNDGGMEFLKNEARIDEAMDAADAAQAAREAKLPENAVKLFDLYAKDAGNWSGMPLVEGNVRLLGDREDRGLLTYLKRAKLVTTFAEEGNTWLVFTRAGIVRATARGFHLGLGSYAQADEDVKLANDAI